MSAKFNKNGVINCTPIDGYDKVSILKNDIVVGENIEEGSKATPWCPNPADGFGNTPDTYKNPIQAKDFIEL